MRVAAKPAENWRTRAGCHLRPHLHLRQARTGSGQPQSAPPATRNVSQKQKEILEFCPDSKKISALAFRGWRRCAVRAGPAIQPADGTPVVQCFGHSTRCVGARTRYATRGEAPGGHARGSCRARPRAVPRVPAPPHGTRFLAPRQASGATRAVTLTGARGGTGTCAAHTGISPGR